MVGLRGVDGSGVLGEEGQRCVLNRCMDPTEMCAMHPYSRLFNEVKNARLVLDCFWLKPLFGGQLEHCEA